MERSESLGIDHNELTRGAIIGSAILHDVKQYRNKTEFERIKINILQTSKNLDF
jgi:hypothetical protein